MLTQLGVEGALVRGENAGHWRLSKPRWTLMSDWLGDVPPAAKEDEGYAELVGRWLRSFGPGTEDDLVWWLGATKGAVRAALAALGAVEVSLDGGGTGWVLPDDVDPEERVEPWAALLPVLDPTVMGWKERDFYLGAHAPAPVRQQRQRRHDGLVGRPHRRLLGAGRRRCGRGPRCSRSCPKAALDALEAEAARLTDWLDGVRVGTVYPSSAMKVVDWVKP